MKKNTFFLIILILFLNFFSFELKSSSLKNISFLSENQSHSTLFKGDITLKNKIKSNISNINDKIMGIIGCISMLVIAFLLSNNKKKISFKIIGAGLFFQFMFAFIILKLNFGKEFFIYANNFIIKILEFANNGSRFLFGNLILPNIPVGTLSDSNSIFSEINHNELYANAGAFFAFNVLPTIIFFSALTAVLYHIRVLEYIVKIIAFVMQKTLKTSGTESFSAAANIFIGQTEAPLLVRPFLNKMTNSEIMAIMTGGFATVAGGVMAAYVATLSSYFPDIAGHLLAASVMSAPASLIMAKIIVPETEKSQTALSSNISLKKNDSNILDAATNGTSIGLNLALNVAAMLISFIALISLLNWVILIIGNCFGFENLLLENILGYIFAPITLLLGVPWSDAVAVGSLLGLKTTVNELVAYIQLANNLESGIISNEKSIVIATYALCGFANISSIGIQIGGLSALAPKRRHDFARLGFKAMIAGSLACFQTAAIAGMLL